MTVSQNERIAARKRSLEKTQSVFIWMMFLLAANTGVLLTLFRERVFFRMFRDELTRFLPPGYDPKRLDYPFLFGFLTPPAWGEALRAHGERFPEHPARGRWEQFRKMRLGLMVSELLMVAAFVVWAILG